MAENQKTPPVFSKWRAVLAWFGMSFASILLALVLGGFALAAAFSFLPMLVLALPIAATVFAYPQSLGMQKYLRSRKPWFLASGLSLMAAVLAGNGLGSVFPPKSLTGAILSYLAGGLIIGLAQWIVLRPISGRWLVWVPVTMLGIGLEGALLQPQLRPFSLFPPGLVYAVVTTLAFAWLTSSGPVDRHAAETREEDRPIARI